MARISIPVYQRHKDCSITGSHYNILKTFTDLAKINLDIELVTCDSYFYQTDKYLRKVQNDSSYSYIPTMIGNVDRYLDTITTLPLRKK